MGDLLRDYYCRVTSFIDAKEMLGHLSLVGGMLIATVFIIDYVYEKKFPKKKLPGVFFVVYFVVSIPILVFAAFPPKCVTDPGFFKTSRINAVIQADALAGSDAQYIQIRNIPQEPELCTAACAEMVLKHYGEGGFDQRKIKELAEARYQNGKPLKYNSATSFIKLTKGMETIGYLWSRRRTTNPDEYFPLIEDQINNSQPVIAGIVYDSSIVPYNIVTHAVVIFGYDSNNLYLLDPSLKTSQALRVPKPVFSEMFMNYLVLTKPKTLAQK